MQKGINESNKNVSPAEIQKYLHGITYPATKDELVEAAETEGAPPEIMNMIRGMPDEEYGGPQDVMKVYGMEKRGNINGE
jgi:hypothetical protein